MWDIRVPPTGDTSTMVDVSPTVDVKSLHMLIAVNYMKETNHGPDAKLYHQQRNDGLMG